MSEFNYQTSAVPNSQLGNNIKSHPKVRSELSALSAIRPAYSFTALLLDWTIVLSCVSLSEHFDSNLIYLLSILIIASRQHGLLVLMHEGAHFRLHKNATLNDTLSDFLAAFPLLADTAAYRQHHQQHHRHLNTDRDPDWVRKFKLKDWQFPKSKTEITTDLVKNLYRAGYEWSVLAWNFSILPLLGRGAKWSGWFRRFTFFAGLGGLIYATGTFQQFLIYWCVPLFLIFPWLQRIRSVAEHFGLPRTNELNHSRNVKASWAEAALFGPHNVNYHLTHHMFPAVPFYNLPKLNQLLEEIDAYREQAHQNKSYLFPSNHSVFSDLINPTASASKDTSKAA